MRCILRGGNYRYISGYLIKADSSAIHRGEDLFVNNNVKDYEKDMIGFFNQGVGFLCFDVPNSREEFEKDYARIRKRYKTAGQLLKEIQEDYNISIGEMHDKTGVSEAVIDRIRHDREGKRDYITIIKLCAGLDLEPPVANELLRLTGFALNNATEENRAYEILINHTQGYSAEMKENLLKEWDIPPLGINSAV